MNNQELAALKLAAQTGNPTAQFKLAICYFQGDGVEQSEEEAVRWCRKAAEQGRSVAKEFLVMLERLLEAVRKRKYHENQLDEFNKMMRK